MCGSRYCLPESISHHSRDVPIDDRSLEASAAWGAKMGKIAIKSQADESWDGKKGKKRLRRLGCVVMGLVVITVVMFVF